MVLKQKKEKENTVAAVAIEATETAAVARIKKAQLLKKKKNKNNNMNFYMNFFLILMAIGICILASILVGTNSEFKEEMRLKEIYQNVNKMFEDIQPPPSPLDEKISKTSNSKDVDGSDGLKTQLKAVSSILLYSSSTNKTMTTATNAINNNNNNNNNNPSRDADKYTTVGNMVSQVMERHMILHSTVSKEDVNDISLSSSSSLSYPPHREVLYKSALATSLRLFEKAIAMTDHYGAHYSMGLVLKIYPDFVLSKIHSENMYVLQTSMNGNYHFRQSFHSFTNKLLNSFKHCNGGNMNIVDSWENENKQQIATTTEKITVYSIDKEEDDKESSSSSSSSSSSRMFNHYFIIMQPKMEENYIFIEGRDGIIHNLYGDKDNNQRKCTLYLHSSQYYLPLFRQFSFKAPRQTKLYDKIATVAHFSGAEYYHWITEILPRIIMLKEEIEAEIESGLDLQGKISLLLPAGSKGKPYIKSFIDLLENILKPNGLQIFKEIIYFNADTDLIAAKEIYMLDYRYQFPKNETNVVTTQEYKDEHSYKQLWASPMLLNKVRDTFLIGTDFIPNQEKNKLIFLIRHADRNRAILNQNEVIEELRKLAAQTNSILEIFDGSKTNAMHTAKLFSEAKAVIGVHGGGFANIIFCPPGIPIFEWTLPEIEFTMYKHMANVLDLKYIPLEGDIPFNHFESRVMVNAEKMRKALSLELL